MDSKDHLLPRGLVSNGVSLWSVDSLYLTIPLEKVQVLNPELTASIVLMEIDKETGEVYHTKEKLSSQKVQVGEDHTGNYRNYSILGDKSGTHKILKIWLSSKTLGHLYFLGITPETLPLIYKAIISDGQVVFPFDALQYSKPTDIDFKRDFLFTGDLEDLLGYYLHLQEVYLRTSQRKRGLHVHSSISSLNVGMDLNERCHTKSISSTFLKAYHKGGELLTKSNLFRETYLSEMDIDLLRTIQRQEITFSGKRHLEVLGMGSVESLDDLLHLTQEAIDQAFLKVMEANFIKAPLRMKRQEGEYTTREEILLSVLEDYLSSGYTIERCVSIITSRLTKKDTKSKVRKEVFKLVEVLLASGTLKGLKDTPERTRSKMTSLDLLSDLFHI